jgi:hypothetical protein
MKGTDTTFAILWISCQMHCIRGEQFLITQKTDMEVAFGHVISTHSIGSEKFDKQFNSILGYIELTKEKMEDVESTLEKYCENNNCQSNGYVKPPSTGLSYYNGFIIKEIKSKITIETDKCDTLPAPNTAHEIDELKQIMRKSKIKIQPLNTINRGNYLMYPKSEVFSSNFARDPANSNVTRWAMVLEDDKMRLDIVNETSTEITYLCMESRSEFTRNKEMSKRLAEKIKKDVEQTALYLRTWTTRIMRCHKKSTTRGDGQDFAVTDQPIVRAIREVYYDMERKLRDTEGTTSE